MLNWNILKDRLWLWLAGCAVFASICAFMYFAATHPFPASVLTILSYWPLLALMWLPVIVYLLLKSGTTLSMPIVYYGYLILLFHVAGPSLPSQGMLNWVKEAGTSNFTVAPLCLTLFLTIYWIWQIKHGSGTNQTRKRVRPLPKENEKELNMGEKYA